MEIINFADQPDIKITLLNISEFKSNHPNITSAHNVPAVDEFKKAVAASEKAMARRIRKLLILGGAWVDALAGHFRDLQRVCARSWA